MVAVGALALVVQLTLVGDRGLSSITDWLWGCLVDGGVAMVLAPVPVLVIAIVLTAIARPEHRRGRARAALRPCTIAIATLALMVGCLVAFPPLDRSGTLDRIGNGQSIDLPGVGTLPPLVMAVLMVASLWIGLFILASAYLVHRNGLGASRDLPLLPPLATICIVWTVPLLGETTNVIDVTTLSGWQHLAETYGTPIVVTGLAAAEILRLRRVNGIGFRGPLPAAAPAEPVWPVEAP